MFKLHMKDPGSAITHFIAMVLSILAATACPWLSLLSA